VLPRRRRRGISSTQCAACSAGRSRRRMSALIPRDSFEPWCGREDSKVFDLNGSIIK
jgi:hypothetical protein